MLIELKMDSNNPSVTPRKVNGDYSQQLTIFLGEAKGFSGFSVQENAVKCLCVVVQRHKNQVPCKLSLPRFTFGFFFFMV